MFRIICPQCKSKVKAWPRSFSQWWKGRRKCGNCGAWMEMANPLLIGVLSGLLAACLVTWSQYWFAGRWAGVLVAIPLGWLGIYIIISTLGKWRVVPGGLADSAGVRRWTRIMLIGVGISILSTVASYTDMYVTFRICKRMGAEDVEQAAALDMLLQRGQFWMIRNWIYLGLIVAGLVLAGVASIMRGKARKVETEDKF